MTDQPEPCTGEEGFCAAHGFHRHPLKQPSEASPSQRPDLRDQIAAALYERERPLRDPHWSDAYAMDREVFEAMATAILPVVQRETAQLRRERDMALNAAGAAYPRLLAQLAADRAKMLRCARTATREEVRLAQEGIAAGIHTAAAWAVQLFEGDPARQTYLQRDEQAGARGPSVDECRDNDRAHWDSKRAGEAP
ncbi:hypothetical protein [Streptomyces sp. NPDC020747]|uniref:hypothetical protein n=1 Tax=Streptomyces sp. NPDC020747 TaxID=3365086 RepID=UPI0037957E0F